MGASELTISTLCDAGLLLTGHFNHLLCEEAGSVALPCRAGG